jgi:hypothetical protein
VELSGLIFVALALVWAVVLIPKALRHHDEVAKTRSVDTVSDTARVLARREAVTAREARLVVPPRATSVAFPAPRTEAPTLPVTPAVPTPRQPVSQASLRKRVEARKVAAASAARRRRRILCALLLVTIGVGGAAGLGALQPWAPAVPAGATLAFLVLARVTVRRDRARWQVTLGELRAAVVEPAPSVAPATVEPAASVETDEPAEPRTVGLPVVSGLDDTSSIPLQLLADLGPTTDPGTLWDPLPVTLPTYVSKPRATRSVRTIDLSDPTISNSGRDAADSALVAENATSTAAAAGADQRAVGS